MVTHIESIWSKARQILGLFYRHFYSSADSDAIKQLYLSLVRPHLEYACQMWDPHLLRDKNKLEGVQKFGLRLASHQWDARYQDLLNLFDLPTLEERRTDLKLGFLFQIIHRLCHFPCVPQFREIAETFGQPTIVNLPCHSPELIHITFCFFPARSEVVTLWTAHVSQQAVISRS